MTRFLGTVREREVVEDFEIVFCSFCILSLYIYIKVISYYYLLLLTSSSYYYFSYFCVCDVCDGGDGIR